MITETFGTYDVYECMSKKIKVYLSGSPPYSPIILQTNAIPSDASLTISLIVPWGKFLQAHMRNNDVVKCEVY